MFRSVSYIAIIAAAASATPAMAENDWTGAYVGAFIGGISPGFENNSQPFFEGATGGCTAPNDDCYSALNDLEDFSGLAGLRFGYDRQINDSYVVGGVGEFAFAGLSNVTYYNGSDSQRTNSERAELRVNTMASVRGRLGLDLGDTLVFASAGVSFVTADFAASTSDTDPRLGVESLSKVAPTIGIGVEHRVSENISLGAGINQVILNEERDIGSLGDIDTESAIKFKNLTSLDLSINFRF